MQTPQTVDWKEYRANAEVTNYLLRTPGEVWQSRLPNFPQDSRTLSDSAEGWREHNRALNRLWKQWLNLHRTNGNLGIGFSQMCRRVARESLVVS